jgi:NAD dependent epimerase/dehydratase family enzyme
VTNREFAKALGHAIHRPAFAPVPGFVLKIIVGEMSEALLTGQRAIPERAERAGFKFTYRTLEAALGELFRR